MSLYLYFILGDSFISAIQQINHVIEKSRRIFPLHHPSILDHSFHLRQIAFKSH